MNAHQCSMTTLGPPWSSSPCFSFFSSFGFSSSALRLVPRRPAINTRGVLKTECSNSLFSNTCKWRKMSPSVTETVIYLVALFRTCVVFVALCRGTNTRVNYRRFAVHYVLPYNLQADVRLHNVAVIQTLTCF